LQQRFRRAQCRHEPPVRQRGAVTCNAQRLGNLSLYAIPRRTATFCHVTQRFTKRDAAPPQNARRHAVARISRSRQKISTFSRVPRGALMCCNVPTSSATVRSVIATTSASFVYMPARVVQNTVVSRMRGARARCTSARYSHATSRHPCQFERTRQPTALTPQQR